MGNDSLVFVLTLLEDKKNILYAFVSEGKIKYIGKSVQYLKARMNGYKNPGPTQNTNIKNNKKIKEILKNGKNGSKTISKSWILFILLFYHQTMLK